MAVIIPFLVSAAISTALTIALAWIVGPTNTANFGEKLRLPDVQTSNYGIAITRLIGQARLAGNIIWQGDIIEESVTTTQEISSGILKPSSTISNTTYLYYANFAVGICGHVIQSITRIWADDVLIYDANSTNSKTLVELGIVIYTGSETQNPSPLIESIDGVASHPAYRGLAYATFHLLPLQAYGNHIPRITFELEGI